MQRPSPSFKYFIFFVFINWEVCVTSQPAARQRWVWEKQAHVWYTCTHIHLFSSIRGKFGVKSICYEYTCIFHLCNFATTMHKQKLYLSLLWVLPRRVGREGRGGFIIFFFAAAFTTHTHPSFAIYHTLVLWILAKVQSVRIFFVNIIISFCLCSHARM